MPNPIPLEALAELATYRQWVCYRLDPPKPGAKPKPVKTPIDVNSGYNASTTDPDTWVSIEQAVDCYQSHPEIAGTGFVFTSADPFTGVDIDQCRDAETGVLAPFAQTIVDRLQSYTEISPSGTGIHIFTRAVLPPGGCHKHNIEMYDHSRYFTFTGQHLDGTPEDIRDRQSEIAAMHAEIFGTDEERAQRAVRTPQQPVDESDADLWDRMERSRVGDKVRRLRSGDTGMHGGDDSGADLALCNYLAFWTGADEGRIDGMFRQTGLYRDKWDEKRGALTYGQRTIIAACSGKSTISPAALRVVAKENPTPSAKAHATVNATVRESGDCEPSLATPPPSVMTLYPDDGDETEPIEVPPFPLDVLPGVARRLVEEAGSALVCSADLVAVPLLVFAGATIGNQGRIALKRDWLVRPNLFAACVAPPGKSKSPALNAAQTGINALQKAAADLYGDELKRFEYEMTEWAKRKGDKGEKPSLPEMAAFFSTDCTMEAAAAMLTHSPGFVVVRDELVQWVKSFDAYRAGRGGDRQSWLALWTGQALKIDRKTTKPIYVREPCLAVVGGVQPEMLAELREEAGRDDGFIDRMLWSYPVTPVHRWSDSIITEETENGVIALFHALRFPRARSVLPAQMSKPAQGAFIRWYDSNSRQVEASSGLTAGMYAKLPIQTARLALILHGMTHPETYQVEEMDAATMDGAITLVEYFRAHAHKAIAELVMQPTGEPERRHPGPVAVPLVERLRLLLADGEWHKRKEIFDSLGRNCTADALTAALEDLHAERETAPPTGGRPAERWKLP